MNWTPGRLRPSLSRLLPSLVDRLRTGIRRASAMVAGNGTYPTLRDCVPVVVRGERGPRR